MVHICIIIEDVPIKIPDLPTTLYVDMIRTCVYILFSGVGTGGAGGASGPPNTTRRGA